MTTIFRDAERHRIPRCLLLLTMLLASSPAMYGQVGSTTWEGVYGESHCIDGGHSVVLAPAYAAVNNGYISAGWSYKYDSDNETCGDADIYVVRTNDAGGLVWSYTYDIGGDDFAYDIKECTDGDFIIVGQTQNTPPNGSNNCFSSATATNDIFLLKISNAGAVTWVQTYGTSSNEEVGWEVVQATVGGGTSAVGDFVVAGWYRNFGNNVWDALLFRVSSNGLTVRWNQTYDLGSNEDFYSLDECTISNPAIPGSGNTGVGDIVAVGSARNTGVNANRDVFLARVSGTAGTINALSYHGAMIYGTGAGIAGDHEKGHSVKEYKPAVVGQQGTIWVTGFCSSYSAGVPPVSAQDEILLFQTGPNPSAGPLAEQIFGDNAAVGTTPGDDIGEALRIKSNGDLILTGRSEFQSHGGFDMFLLDVTTGFAINRFRQYGGTDEDWGMSLEEVTNGFVSPAGYILSGSNASQGTDPGQMYLVRPDGAGDTPEDCDLSRNPNKVDPNRPWSAVNPTRTQPLGRCEPDVVDTQRFWEELICEYTEPSPKRLIQSPHIRMQKNGSGVYPNPVRRDAAFNLEYIAETAGEMKVSVADVAGRIVHTSEHHYAAGMKRLNIATQGWPVGVYVITLGAGETLMTMQIVVEE